MPHDFVKPCGLDRLDPLLLVEFIYWDALVLQGKEEEKHLVDLLLVELVFLLQLLKFHHKLFFLDEQVDFPVS